MIIFIAFTLLAAIGLLLSGGRLGHLAHLGLRGEVVILAVFAAQSVSRGRLVTQSTVHLEWNPVLPWFVLTAILLVMLVYNRRVAGMQLAAFGTALNLLVVALNQGMPISASALALWNGTARGVASSGFYVLSGPGTRLSALGDVLAVPSLVHLLPGLVLSPGDLLLIVGVVVAVLSATGTAPDRVSTAQTPVAM